MFVPTSKVVPQVTKSEGPGEAVSDAAAYLNESKNIETGVSLDFKAQFSLK